MKILITAAGSRGDVAPYTGLGARLTAAGHHVTLATGEVFAPLVREAGLEFRPLPADPRGAGPARTKRELMRTAAAFTRRLATGMKDALADDTELLLLSTTTAPLGWHLTEATGVPSMGAYLVPTEPTGAFPPVIGGTRSLGHFGNRALGRLSLRIADRIFAEAVRDLRTDLGLPPAAPGTIRRRRQATNWPILHGFSEVLVPRPSDWRETLTITGNWWPHTANAPLPPEVEDFLASGPPPVLIGFGSMPADDAEHLSTLAVTALRRAGVRGILQTGRAGLTASDDDVLTIDDLPHSALFPRLAAVVHHAGAGTTAATLRAGVPSVPVPFTADQPFWATRLTALGTAPRPIPFAALTAERLSDALRHVLNEPSYANAAQTAARRMASEDGAGQVVKAIDAVHRRD
ncbi:glycosyltransferase family 1 protein [Streptomyces sp. AV19]|uniref:glycosyltransferase n=1 Tax=Streptomyces sp. AV19 TaxID=2793068 RepID=UPI0018FF10E2|nr:glycosyltransferase [Streptomyces sp. AV19]MBH1933481.1 glycosyltransferase family 1 protein [Streptomyces sp. AV19]MDG4532130.1 glycosyltransferase [Streptomyces sp. AV19]